eukprot:CAMPEP_0197522098 /NCGR_PEP_ID=MMETSP1318-20131121/7288_1 /TAXON_ID=552666 /ORGANISM="Partenskyella glossopodia, Strain RCC365" /LENGTH=168 /DNA_ID=CAMNT_0043074335 /DNA_START=117 /DNA_END=626 /DNA_ORIENTATION=+
MALVNLTICTLDVAQDPKLRDSQVKAIISKHKSLRRVNVRGCCHLTDSSILTISSLVPKLSDLNVSYCLQISDAGIRHLKSCRYLKYLHTAACNKVSEEALEVLYKSCKLLKRPFMPMPRLVRVNGVYGLSKLKASSPRLLSAALEDSRNKQQQHESGFRLYVDEDKS